MTSPIPVQLLGNLGHRHRYINDLVHQTYSKNVPFHTIQDLPEASTVDRLFKIDLACKYKDVDYTLNTLKGDDMIFVARALKSTWLLQREYSNIVNPAFLENELYPQMRLQAINKMKHWIHLNLRDPDRCQCFYTFYKVSDFKLAAKFLQHCPSEFIIKEFSNILKINISPELLKRLSEKAPYVTKIYFDSLNDDQLLLSKYLQRSKEFFDIVNYVLRSDPETFFYVIENFFNIHEFPPFSSEMTKYIMRNHKDKFMNKPELYTCKFLDMNTVAKCLNPEEIKDLIRLLATARYNYLSFSYENVEPLIKHLSIEDRTTIKKQIFVDRDYGPVVCEWPYALPEEPELDHRSLKPQNGLFMDNNDYFRQDSEEDSHMDFRSYNRRKIKRKRRRKILRKTLLDELFDEYRFKSYSETLTELQKRLRAESSAENRQYMLLVLISKTGGRLEDLVSFFELLKQFKNEPVHIRATIVRSFVKRAFVWRLPPESWADLLKWAHGLGLDGSEPEAACSEGLHAVVLRDILANTTPTPEIWKAFLDDFSTFTDYKLTADERRIISTRLPALLLAEYGSCPEKAEQRLDQLLDTLSAYHIRFDLYPGTVDAIAEIAKRDIELAKPLLLRLYTARAARKTLFKENFKLIPTDASYVNALRHDCSVLDDTEQFVKVAKAGSIQERFLRKLALYFAEKDGLAQRYRDTLESLACNTKKNMSKSERVQLIKMARALALLAGSAFPSLLSKFNHGPREVQCGVAQKVLAAALRANCHLVRPPFDIDSFGWKAAGAKAVANFVTTCRQKDVEQNVQKTLRWGRTMRIGLRLADRGTKTREPYEIVAMKRPNVASSYALRHFRRRGKTSNPEIWQSVRPTMEKYVENVIRMRATRCYRRERIFGDFYENDKVLRYIPSAFKEEFCVTLCKGYKNASIKIPEVLINYLLTLLPAEYENFLLQEMKDFFHRNLAFEIISSNYSYTHRLYTVSDVIAKYLILSTSNEMVEERMQNIGNRFFKCIEEGWRRLTEENDSESVSFVLRIIDKFLSSLKVNKVFFDTKYACQPVFERVCEWLHGFLPIEKWFDVYSKLQLAMIYFKSVRLCIENSPQTFTDESKKMNEGVRMLGITYGQLISNAIEDLIQKYYPSIIHLYKHEILNYINFLCKSSDESTDNFKIAVMKGILSAKQLSSSSQIVAFHLYIKYDDRRRRNPYLEEIRHILKFTENKEIRFVVVSTHIWDLLH